MNKEENIHKEDLINMILGGLIALKSAQQAGSVSRSPGSEALFLGKWLKRAKKQKLYPKSVSENIDNFLSLYTAKGRNADLTSSFFQLYNEYRMDKAIAVNVENTPKQRFDMAMDILREKNWSISIPIDHDDLADVPYQPNKDKALFVLKKNWDNVFNDEGEQIKALNLSVVSSAQEVIDSLYLQGFILAQESTIRKSKDSFHHFTLFPENNYTGIAAIPSQFRD